MKKRNLVPLAALLCALCIPSTAYAGDINSAEQGILDAIAGTQEYNGEYYRVTDGYRAKVSDYLNRDDIDLSQQEVNDYLFQFYRNIPTGIASGYMEKVEQPEGAGDSNGGEAGAEGTGASGGDVTGDSSGNDAQKEAAAGSQTPSEKETGATGDDGASIGSGITGAAGMASLAGAEPQKDAQGNIVDNTTGTTQSGKLEYKVIPMDGVMYVWDTETLDVHAEAYKDSDIIGTLALGDKVTITGGATTGWAEIDFEGKNGYVSAVYLRTDGYMKDQGVEVEEEEEQKQAEEAKKAEEERKAQEEKKKAEEEAKKAEEAEQAQVEEPAEPEKDYSDAKPVEKSVNLGMIALVVVVVCAAALGGVLFYHKKNSRSGKR